MQERFREQEIKKTAEVFVQQLSLRRDIPQGVIDTQDACAFAESIAQHHPPMGFFDRLTTGLDFLDLNRFDNSIQKMAEAIQEEVTNQPYYVVVPKRGSSNDWMYQQMLTRGVPPAKAILDTHVVDTRQVTYERIQRLASKLPKKAKFLIIDDFAPTGEQISDICLYPQFLQGRNMSIFLLTMSARAEQRIKLADSSVSFHIFDKKIQSLPEILTQQDCLFLQNLEKNLIAEPLDVDEFDDSSALFWAWYKVPDCVPNFFEGKSGVPPLIRPERFTEPY